MIKIIQGNLLQAEENIIGHQVNCQSVMGSGLAKQIRDVYPHVYESYLEYCKNSTPKDLLGNCQFVAINESDKYIANLFGQLKYGRKKNQYTDYNALHRALKKLKDVAVYHDFSVALPYKIGCDRGGGDWDIVYDIIDSVFKDWKVTLYKI